MAMGFITVFLSIRVGIRIHKKTQDVKGPARHLSPALSLQLAGEAIIGLGTRFCNRPMDRCYFRLEY